ncbi:cytochrome P450 2C31-like [Sphaerodactylus townsendi]|uniref:cytochrome P450 2C31-like n=1 Tax=Sphaerodactylus townsendi TaxID=933632 RepID=UPI002025D0D2|nr:cytochrome P450 2C31-like [Sphaerodactylus townsendi]
MNGRFNPNSLRDWLHLGFVIHHVAGWKRTLDQQARSMDKRPKTLPCISHHDLSHIRSSQGQPFDPTLHITNSVTNVFCLLNFGQRFSIGDEDFLKLRNALSQVLQFTTTLSHILYEAFPWLMKHLPGPHKKVFETRDYVASFVSKEIEKHKVHQSLHEPQDFIDYYLLQMMKSKGDPNSTYNEENLIESIMDLFAAGTETTTTTLLWGLLLMTNYPDIQGKVQKEIDDMLGSSQSFSYQDKKKLPYTNAVIHEIQRYQYILLFGVHRQCSKEVNMFGFCIPKGATVVIDIQSVLLDPKQWKTPHMFNPNHFLDQHGHFVEREAFLPFGAGARVCPGEQLARIELFIFFVRMLRTFTFQPPEGVEKIQEDVVVRMTSPPCPYKVCAIPRSNA